MRRVNTARQCAILAAAAINSVALAQSSSSDVTTCVAQELERAPDSATLGEIRARCNAARTTVGSGGTGLALKPNAGETGAVEQRIKEEGSVWDRPFVLIPHRPNYLLPASVTHGLKSSPTWTPSSSNTEIKFQLSFKFPVSPQFWNDSAILMAGYTGTAWWQAYNRDESSPFREYNHEPELMLALRNSGLQFLGINHRATILSLNHQSNGRSQSGSRSWNRVIAEGLFERGSEFWFSVRAWYRIPEGNNDDNPDITKYMGHAEFKVGRKNSWGDLTLTGRNWGRKPFTQLEWSKPIPGLGNLRWYVQASDGYGDSLIDYSVKVRRLGVGIALSDYF